MKPEPSHDPAPEALTLAFTMHRGKLNRQQQDCLLANGVIHQENVLPITAMTLPADDVLLAVADGVSSSPAPRLASRIVLEALARTAQERWNGGMKALSPLGTSARRKRNWPRNWPITRIPSALPQRSQ